MPGRPILGNQRNMLGSTKADRKKIREDAMARAAANKLCLLPGDNDAVAASKLQQSKRRSEQKAEREAKIARTAAARVAGRKAFLARTFSEQTLREQIAITETRIRSLKYTLAKMVAGQLAATKAERNQPQAELD